MRTCIIHNPKSGSAEQFDAVRHELSGSRDLAIREPETPEQVTQATAEAIQEGCELLVAAGGDGTINAVVNGMAADFRQARLGIIPLGTGNDLCRTLDIPSDPREAASLLHSGQTRAIDLYLAETATQSVYGINVAAGGFSGQVHESLTEELKATWGPLAYLRGAVGALPDLTAYHTDFRFDDGPPERIAAFNVIVANGRTSAGGYRVGPNADPEDGLLDVVVVQYGPLLDLAVVAARLLAGNYQESDQVVARRVRQLEVTSDPGMWFSIDGDLRSNEPTRFRVVPKAISVVVGSEYVASRPESQRETVRI